MRLSIFALSLVLLAAVASPAQAKLEICNKTPSPFLVAIAYETDADIISQGWWTVDPDKCETVVSTDLNRRYYYHYVKSRALNVEWAGTFSFCTNDEPQFRISGSGSCESRNFNMTGFRQIDVGTNKDFTLDISMGHPTVAPDQAAEPVIEAAPPAQNAVTPATTTTPAPAAAVPATPAPATPAPVEAAAPAVTEPAPAPAEVAPTAEEPAAAEPAPAAPAQ